MRRLLFALTLCAALLPGLALAQETGALPDPGPKAVTLTNPLDKCPPNARPDDPCRVTIPELIGTVIKGMIGIIGALALGVFVYGGFTLLTSRGDSGKIQAGMDAMKWSVLGIVVVFSSYALVSFVLTSITGRAG